ncbi:sensor domain-containing protein [Noviherbaspirillum sp.]|uniref:sensor domain-containing protein n=1 Tax=Noviherbaspirillum sp. TaxID=1926288 RepID=UPI002D4C3B5A|nr:EAL domain-containing protein [Noviherbaspirillum sp.]HZW19752.1 EAL domain-containing protein [Noviherbaspirillum sp.]
MEDNPARRAVTKIDTSFLEPQALLQAVFTIETVGVLFFNLDGTIIDANPAFERMCGYTRDELCTTGHWKQLTDPQFFEITFKVAERLAATGRTPPYEKLMVRKDGTQWWGLFAPTRLSGSGLESKCAEFILDITERKRAEAALGESEERFRSLVQGFAQAVWETDAEGVVVADSPSWRAYTGQTIEEWMGDGWLNAVHPDDRDFARREWHEALQEVKVANAEFRLKFAKGGDWRWTNVRVAPIFDAGGAVRKWVGINIDVNEQRCMQEALRASEERLRALFDSMNEAFAIMEAVPDEAGSIADYRFIETNPAFDRHTGLGDPRGHSIRSLLPDNEPIWTERFGRVLHAGEPVQFEAYVAARDRWLSVSATPLGSDNDLRLAVVFTDITDRKQVEEQVRHASLHDALTGLPNRSMLFEYASHLLPHNRRTSHSAAVLFLDLDRFKPINDTHGHAVGDLVLKEVASRLLAGTRAEDIVVRLGGDEFVILLQDLKSRSAAAEVARHILDRINQPYLIGDLSLSLSTSIGISTFPGDGQDLDTLISHADTAMYQAKQNGSNNYQFYSPAYSAETRLLRIIEQQLKSALRNNAFQLLYQPVMDVETGRIVSVEALLRCRETGIGPDRFVPVAEATGIINPIGRWLLSEAARQHKAWRDHGLPLIPIAINVSVVEFRDRDFPERFASTFREHGIDTNALQLEVTETAVMDDIEHTVIILSRLQALGVKILLDDFGTGHSSLAYLARLPLNKVKIDKSFVLPLDSDTTSRVVTNAMIALSRTLGLEVVAEGVETESALDYIRSHGCTQAQGYYFGLPMSGDEFEHWYRGSRLADPARPVI